MKCLFVLICLVFISESSFAKWQSVTTDLKNDCVVISSATEEAPIDFYRAECKAFAGLTLFIEGGDLRYGPEIFYNGVKIDLMRPMHFHDLNEEKIEWFYDLKVDNEGLGKLEWTGLLYSLSVSNDEGDKNVVQFYAVSLRGEHSCVVGLSASKDTAMKALLDPRGSCLSGLK